MKRNTNSAYGATPQPKPKYISFGDFSMDATGLSVAMPGASGKGAAPQRMPLSGPFEVLGRARDPKSEGWARLLSWRDDDGCIHRYPVADADLHGDAAALCGALASKGLRIVTGRHRADLIRYLNEVSVHDRVTTVERSGWHQIGDARVFALPNLTVGAVADETIIVEGAATAPFEARGSLSDWRDGVAALVSGHSRAVFAVSIAFAGPLLELLGQEGGGFNFFGQSSRGKTTLAQAAASVWGKGATPGFVRSWRSTANAIEAAAALHTGTSLVLDELGVIDAKEATSAAYQLAVGTGKGRAARDGSLRQSLTWQTMVVSTGELRLTDKLTEARQRARAGQQVRIVDVPADAGKGFGVFDHQGVHGEAKLLADAIKTAACSSFGTAGPEFVRLLIGDGDEKSAETIKEMIVAFRDTHAPAGADGQVLRICDRFGLVAAAGELACEFGVVPWAPGEALDAAGRCFQDWFDARGGAEAGEVHAALSAVHLFIEQHGDSRFEPLQNALPRPVNNRAGWRKGEGVDRRWLIPKEVWKSEICAGQDPTFVARTLAERGMLLRASDGFQRVENIEGRSMRVYVVTAALMSEPDCG